MNDKVRIKYKFNETTLERATGSKLCLGAVTHDGTHYVPCNLSHHRDKSVERRVTRQGEKRLYGGCDRTIKIGVGKQQA